MKKFLSILIFGIYLFNPVFSQSEDREITISIDKFKEYEFQKDIPPGDTPFRYFIVSPLSENTIWLGSYCLEYELNLETGEFTNITEILGYKINSSLILSYKCTRQDPFDHDIFWIYLNGTGLIKYSRSLKSHKLIKINCGNSITITDKKVLLGGQNGLICSVNKLNGSIDSLNTGLDESINNIASDKSGKYIINGRYFYSLTENFTSIITQAEKSKYKSDIFQRHWLKPRGYFTKVNQGKEVWFYKYKQLFVYDTLPGNLLNLEYRPPADIVSP